MKTRTSAALILGSAIIWAAVIMACSSALKGTECYDKIQNLLAAGVISHLIIIWGPFVYISRKTKYNKSEKGI